MSSEIKPSLTAGIANRSQQSIKIPGPRSYGSAISKLEIYNFYGISQIFHIGYTHHFIYLSGNLAFLLVHAYIYHGMTRKKILSLISTVFLTVLIFTCPAQCYELAEGDTLLKLAIFTPDAKVFDRPNGEQIGTIDRGRVIRLLSSQERWLEFTTWDYPSAWLRWEYTQTLEEWGSSPSFNDIQRSILTWEKAVKNVDREIELSLSSIIDIRDKIAAGKISVDYGIAVLEKERARIEDSFRSLHDYNCPDILDAASEKLDSKRWAIHQGLYYLMKYIYEGEEESGIAAGKFFQRAEDMTIQYSQTIFQVKSKYDLYQEDLPSEKDE